MPNIRCFPGEYTMRLRGTAPHPLPPDAPWKGLVGQGQVAAGALRQLLRLRPSEAPLDDSQRAIGRPVASHPTQHEGGPEAIAEPSCARLAA